MKKLGTIVKDSATGLEGMLTHMCVNIDRQVQYIFQPKLLNSKTGKPVERMWLTDPRIVGGIDYNIDLPYAVLGTIVEDMASGFIGTAINICLHISGCVHVEIQPNIVLAETGTVGGVIDLDIRRLKGVAIPVLTDEELETSQKKNPSPMDCPEYRAMPEF